MSDPLAPLPGDPASLAAAAHRLGTMSARVQQERTAFHDGSGAVTVSVLDSGSAMRLGILHDAMRGVEAAFERIEHAGTGVAGRLEEHARAWHRVEDQLADLREEVARAERDAQDAEGLGDPGTARRRARQATEDARAHGHELKRTLLEQRAALVGQVRSQITGFDPSWTEVPAEAIRSASLASPTTRAHGQLVDGTISTHDAWQVMGWAYGEVADDDVRAERESTWHQVAGGADEFATLLRGSVTDTGRAIAHPLDTLEGIARLSYDVQTHPLETGWLLGQGFIDPYRDEIDRGEPGRAVGRGLAGVVEIGVGAKGLTKGLKAAREGGALERVTAGLALARRAREARRLRGLGTRLGTSSTWQFADEADAARAMANPVARSTYRVHFEQLPTDYVLGDRGELVVVRGPETLLRRDVPVPTRQVREMALRLQASGGKKIEGYAGNRRWKNLSGSEFDAARLPAFRADGTAISYREYDVHAKGTLASGDRGLERIVRSDSDVWYTDDHYKTFVRLR